MTLRSLIGKLSSELPDYVLPEATAAHTRHYMPVVQGKGESKTKIFDTFVHVTAGESLWIRWNVELSGPEELLLRTLIESLSYLGRAESLVIATVEPRLPKTISGEKWTTPSSESALDNGEPVRLLVAQLPDVYSEWLAGQVESAGGKSKKKKEGSTLPASVFEAMQLDTADWKKQGWNQPPGSRWVDYVRPSDCFKISPRASRASRRGNYPTVARYAIVSKVPPSITEALSLSERFHQALCSRLREGENSVSLTGRNHDGSPAAGNEHVYFLPECDQHGYITHVTLYAKGGLDDAACQAIGKVKRVWGAEGFDVDIILLATGHADDFKVASPYFRKSHVWKSLTPFIPVRHPKASRKGVKKIDERSGLQIGSPEQDCWRLVEMLASNLDGIQFLGSRIQYGLRDVPCLHFQRNRRNGHGLRAGTNGYALQIEFKEKTAMPFGVGYGAHFGLGLFAPQE
jgi:CRISPR-associated protein Csb2